MVSGITVIGSCAPRNSACVPAASRCSRYRSSTSAATLVAPQAMNRLRPSATAGVPGNVPPITSKSPRGDVREVPGGRHARAEVRIVGEQRLAAGASACRPRPSCWSPGPQCCAPVRKSRTAGSPVERLDVNAADQDEAVGRAGRRVGQACAIAASPAHPTRPTCSDPDPLPLTRPTLPPCQDAQPVRRVRRHQLRHASLADRADEIVAQQLERVVAAQVPRHHLHPDDDVRRRSRARARSGAA